MPLPPGLAAYLAKKKKPQTKNQKLVSKVTAKHGKASGKPKAEVAREKSGAPKPPWEANLEKKQGRSE